MSTIAYETRMLRPRGETVKIVIVRAGIEMVLNGEYLRLACGATVDLPAEAADALLRSGAADRVMGNAAAPTTLLEDPENGD